MASVLAIVSKAVFEKQAGGAGLGSVLALDQYGSTHRALGGLADGGALFMVTVRPPDEQLWLVAVLEKPKLGKSGWSAKANQVAMTNLSAIKSKLKFATGTGIQAKAGALGMSLQTPRTLTAEDEALIRAAIKAPAAGAKQVAAKAVAAKPAAVAKPAAAKPAAAKSAAKPKAAAKPAAVGSEVDTIRAAIAADDGEAALLAALAWWQRERAPAIANLIDAISARISGPAVTDDIEFTRLAGLRRPVDLGRVLPSIPSLAVGFLPTAAELLVAYPDDPRLTAAFGTWILEPVTTSTSKNSFWTTLFKRALELRDTRLVEPMQQRLAKKPEKSAWWPKFYNVLTRTVKKLSMPTPAVDAKAIAALTKEAKSLSVVEPGEAPDVKPVRDVAPKLTGPLLAQAAKQLAAGHLTAAIDAMVERWREIRVPALADLVDRATRLLPTFGRPLITASKAGAGFSTLHTAQPQWMEAFESDLAGRMPQLLQNFGLTPKLAPLQVAQLATLPDDPRISLRLTEELDRNVNGENTKYWKSVFELLERHRDVRTFEPIRNQYRDFKSTFLYTSRPAKRIMEPLIRDPAKLFASWPLAYSAEDAKLAATLATAIDKQLAALEGEERALVAAIVAEPADDGPRMVYADWLQEREHPRGELMVLDLKGTLTEAEADRREELLERPYLFGELHDVFSGFTRDRGLPSAVKTRNQPNALNWIAAARHPLTPALAELELYYPRDRTGPAVQTFVAAATGLRKIINLPDRVDDFVLEYGKHWKLVPDPEESYRRNLERIR